MRNRYFTFLLSVMLPSVLSGEPTYSDTLPDNLGVWVPDGSDGYYKNPVIYADYSDPDVILVDGNYYMTASSFNCVPGLPILHSTDLVNWSLVNYALPVLYPKDTFNAPRHGNGVWAPAIRYHNNEYYIYYGDPDFGIFMTRANDPLGEWTKPLLIKEGKGWIDPCPLWDDDGKVYLVHAWAGSRSGLKSILVVHEMSADGTQLKDEGVLVFDGHIGNRVVEGPKFYKQDGYYYIFAPAGGVSTGWQLVLRSHDVFGPYESKKVLHQGDTKINGPHQGAWIKTPDQQEDWFVHFQDREAYGRIVHLQPMTWKHGWPVIGVDKNKDGIGEPVEEYKKPAIPGIHKLSTPVSSDEFNEPRMALQWQWHANPAQGIGFPSGRLGFFRLNALPKPMYYQNLWDLPNLLLQKLPAEEFTATTKLDFYPTQEGDKLGFVIMGLDYAYLGLVNTAEGILLQQVECFDAESGKAEKINMSESISGNTFFMRAVVKKNAICQFYYSTDGATFKPIGGEFAAKPGKWIGAKIGFFSTAEKRTNNSGYTNIDWFRVTNNESKN